MYTGNKWPGRLLAAEMLFSANNCYKRLQACLQILCLKKTVKLREKKDIYIFVSLSYQKAPNVSMTTILKTTKKNKEKWQVL